MDQSAAPLANRRPDDAGERSPARSDAGADRAQAQRGERLVVPVLWAAAALVAGACARLVTAVARWMAWHHPRPEDGRGWLRVAARSCQLAIPPQSTGTVVSKGMAALSDELRAEYLFSGLNA